MTEDLKKEKKKRMFFIRALADYGRGIFFTAVGVFFFVRSYLNLSFNEIFPPDSVDKIFGVLCVVYGVWRIFRGYKKSNIM